MKTLLLPLLACGLLFSATNVEAASTDDFSLNVEVPKNKPYVQIIIGCEKQSQIVLDLHKIVSISLHSYMLDDKIPILELTVDSMGNNSVRIYTVLKKSGGKYLSGVAERAASRAAERGALTVSKQYPHTTHAHSIEYCALSKIEIQKAYAKLIKAWTNKKGDKITIK